MKYFILFLGLIHLCDASTYTLNHIMKSAKQNSHMTKALQQERLALNAKNRASTASEPFELFMEGTQASPNLGKRDNEYAVGLSKKIFLGGIQQQEQKINHLNNQAYLLEKERVILNFENGLKNLYHQHCLDLQNYRSFHKSYLDLVKLYKKKQKAYNYQEIAKTELMQLEVEKNRLYAQLQELKMKQQISKENLMILSALPNNKHTAFSCKDMYPIRSNIRLSNTFNLSKKAYKKRLQSTQEKVKRYSKALESVDLSLQYSNELDIEKYTVGVSIPLSFTSKKSEYERAAALYENSAISSSFQQNMKEKRSMLSQLKTELKSHTTMLHTLKVNYRNYKKKLLPLIKKSYDLGETSVIEYLLNRQKSYQLNQEIYATQKAYYQTLFQLYTLSETKEK